MPTSPVPSRNSPRRCDDFLILADGIGVDIAAKLLYGEAFPANLNGTDFIPAFLAARAAAADDRPCSAQSAPMPKPQPRNSAQIAPQHNFVVVA